MSFFKTQKAPMTNRDELLVRITRFDEQIAEAQKLRDQALQASASGNFAKAWHLMQQADKTLLESNRAILGS